MNSPKERQGNLNLYLVRHGQTEANVERSLYKEVADHAVCLTEKGKRQALHAGKFLAAFLQKEHETNPDAFGVIRLWHSPYYRTRQTANNILFELGQTFDPETGIVSYREESFMFEQKAGLYDGMTHESFRAKHPSESKDYKRHQKFFGKSYAQTPLGESRLDVAFRSKHHFGTILRDYKERNIRHVIIVSHGVTIRAYEMAWMRYPPEWLDAEKNPGNCWVRHIHGNGAEGYKDEGYIFGEDAPLKKPRATQAQHKGADQVFMLKPQRSNIIMPEGIKVIDPFKQRCP